MKLTMRKLVFHVLMTVLAVPAFVAYGDLPEVQLASLTMDRSSTFDLAGTNFVIGSFVSQVDSSVITNKTATDEIPVLTIGENDADSKLGGKICGPLVLKKIGTGDLFLDEAKLEGAVKIELAGGTLSGGASANADLVYEQSGGVNKAQIVVSGTLSVSGTPSFAVPFAGCDTVFFSYADASAATVALLESAAVTGASEGATVTRNVTTKEFRYRAQIPLTGTFDAQGGTVELVGNDFVHTFSSNGTFEVLSGSGTMEVLIIGGGGGGHVGQGGAGGAGGVIYREALAVTPGKYEIVVGAGGVGAKCSDTADSVVQNAQSGANSSAFDLTAIGGGRGAYVGGNGAAGGSGGGNSRLSPDTKGGAGTDGQGFAGGEGTSYSGGGGGGAGAPGAWGHPSHGGIGRRFDISGKEREYAGGGAGGTCGFYRLGCGGLANSRYNIGLDGVPGTGAGGGAGGFQGVKAGLFGGHGGSGVVIVRYRASNLARIGNLQGATGGDQIVTYRENGKKWCAHIFLSNGVFRLPVTNRRIQLLAVGGGGGGAELNGGGGGGGGVLVVSNLFVAAGDYPVEIGAGGSACLSSTFTSNGCPTKVFDYVIPGGGYSRSGDTGFPGASGGGGAYASCAAWKNTPGVNEYGQAIYGYPRDYLSGGAGYLNWGHAGAVAQLSNANGYGYAGGGGGAGEPGHSWHESGKQGRGGDGIRCDFAGEEQWYGGGGGGSMNFGSESQSPLGGKGGGGRGGWYDKTQCRANGNPGDPNTGGGGGGGSKSGSGGAGGSGIVIIRYELTTNGLVIVFR